MNRKKESPSKRSGAKEKIIDTLIADVSTLQQENIMNAKQHSELSNKLETVRSVQEEHGKILLSNAQEIREHGKIMLENTKEIKENAEALKYIMNIQVNGRIGLQESLQDIYLATEDIRQRYKLRKSVVNFIKNTTEGKFLSTRIGKFVAIFSAMWITFSTLHTLGFESMHPWNIMKSLIEWVMKIL